MKEQGSQADLPELVLQIQGLVQVLQLALGRKGLLR
jgi:hypothetical protein